MKCQDCKKEVGYSKLYCPHCSAELFKGKEEPSRSIWPVFNVIEKNAGMR